MFDIMCTIFSIDDEEDTKGLKWNFDAINFGGLPHWRLLNGFYLFNIFKFGRPYDREV